MDIAALIMYVLLGVFGLFVLISALIGLGRGLKKTVGSTVVIVLSAIVAYIVTVLVFKPTPSESGIITEKLLELMQDSDFASVLEMEGIRDALNYYVYMLTAPFIFVLLFVVARFVLGIIMRIIVRFIPIMNNIPKVAKRLGGLGVGLVNGAALFLILFMPLLGTVDVIGAAIDDLGALQENVETAKGEEAKTENLSAEIQPETYGEPEITDYLDAVTDSGVGKVLLDCGGRLMYDTLSSTTYYGEKVVLRNEIDVVIDMATDLTSIDGDGSSMMVAIDAVVGGVDRSPIVANFAADVMSEMATSWLEGEDFMGIERVSMGSWIDPMFDTVLGILATEDREHVRDDLKSVADFMHVADEYGFLGSEDMDSESFQAFGEAGTLTHLLETIEGNDRMLPLIDELNVACIRIIADELGFLESHEEVYEDLVKELAGYVNQYNGGMINKGEATDMIAYELRDHGVRLSDEEMNALIGALLSEYSEVYSDMPERIKDFFRLYNAAAGSALIENSDGTLTANGVVLTTYNAYSYKNSQAYILASSGISIGDAATLTSGKDMKTVLITTDQILASVVKYGDIDDRHAESEHIDAVMVAMMEAFDNLGDAKLHASHVMSQMGHVLDKMHETSVFHGTTESFLTALMQSHKVADSIGLDIIEMTDFANTIHSGMGNGTGYEQISVTVSHSFDVLENINDGEVKKEKIQELMKDLTPETAKVMQEITTPSLMQNYGVTKENAEKSSNAVSSLFGNMADYTTNHPQGNMSDEEYKESISHEAEAVDKIITLAVKANEEIDDKEPLFDTDGGEGALEMSAYDVVDLFATSTVAEDTVNELVIGNEDAEGKFDPLGAGNGFLESDRAEMTEALNAYGADNADVEGIDEKLTNIGAFFGIEYGA